MVKRPASLKVRALQWLAQREHSRAELRDRLLRLLKAAPAGDGDGDDDGAEPAVAPEQEVDTLLDWLEARRYLDNQRFVESRVAARSARFGNLRIQHELKQHGTTLGPEAAQSLRDSELGRAREVWQRKYGEPAPDAAGRMRQMRFLVGRGFSAEIVKQVLRGTGDE